MWNIINVNTNRVASKKISIVADDKIPFLKGVLEPYAQIRYMPGNEINTADLTGTDALIIRTRTRVHDSLLKGTPIRYIASATIGVDHIDAKACQARGVEWSNAPGCNSGSVCQYMAAALVHLSNAHDLCFSGKVLGIVGVGSVGSKVEKLGKILGFKVLLNDPPRERSEGPGDFTDLDTIMRESDIVTFHVPLILTGPDRTFEMLHEGRIKRMKPGAWVINTSRGDVLHEDTLLDALSEGRLGGAILDVWKNEPAICRDLLSAAELGTPHIAGYSLDGKANGTSQAVQNLAEFFQLNLDLWYPEYIPEPAKATLSMDSEGKTKEEILKYYIAATYDILKDSHALKSETENFEKLRGNHPPRREFHAFSILDKKLPVALRHDLLKLGFNVL
jgi:erythronate-4-phosphate dehydrogenase